MLNHARFDKAAQQGRIIGARYLAFLMIGVAALAVFL